MDQEQFTDLFLMTTHAQLVLLRDIHNKMTFPGWKDSRNEWLEEFKQVQNNTLLVLQRLEGVYAALNKQQEEVAPAPKPPPTPSPSVSASRPDDPTVGFEILGMVPDLESGESDGEQS